MIVTSDEFLGGGYVDSKVRTPLENLVATVRALDGQASDLAPIDELVQHLQGTSQHILFQWPDPDGYPEEGDVQLGTSRFLDRLLWNMEVMELDPGGFDFDVPGLLSSAGVPPGDENAVVTWFFDLFFQDQLGQAERDLALEFLQTLPSGGSGPLDPLAPDYELRLTLFAAYVATFPQALQQ